MQISWWWFCKKKKEMPKCMVITIRVFFFIFRLMARRSVLFPLMWPFSSAALAADSRCSSLCPDGMIWRWDPAETTLGLSHLHKLTCHIGGFAAVDWVHATVHCWFQLSATCNGIQWVDEYISCKENPCYVVFSLLNRVIKKKPRMREH